MRDIGRRGMSEFDSGDGGIVHDAPDADQDTSYGQDDVIVAEYTDGSQVGVVDTNHDHYADLLAVDRDGDGHPEVVYTNEHGGRALDTATYDYDEDGRPDLVAVDRNEDGHVDELIADRDHDGHPDLVIRDDDHDSRADHLFVDTNHDGRLDLAAVDRDEDGHPDVIISDSNYDGTPDTVHYGDTDRNPLGDASSVDPYASH
jgi:hypothetical protein